MTFEEVYGYFGSGYRLQKDTGMSHSNFQNWRERGYIPIMMQIRIEKATKGKLKASLSHCMNEADNVNN